MEHESLRTQIAGIRLEHPLMNAAGTCRRVEEVRELARSATAAIVVGSITLLPRDGNSGDVYYPGPPFSLNSLGMPNPGRPYYEKALPEMVAVARDANKPIFVSVAGFSPSDYADLAELAFKGGVDLVKLNLGCPNVWDGGVQKSIASFDPGTIAEVLRRVEERVGVDAKVAVKLSPFSNPLALGEAAKVIGASRLVKVVTAVNTFPNAFAFRGAKPAITPADGLAGFAGPAIKPIGLGQVRQLRALLPARIDIVGVGGIMCGLDVHEYRMCGAAATEIATTYLNEGEGIFGTILSQLLDIPGVVGEPASQ